MAYHSANNSVTARIHLPHWQQNFTYSTITTSPTEMKNWAAAYKFMSTAAQLWMASSDETNDVGIKILIEGLVEETINGVVEWVKASEELALHGTDARTPVETVNTYIRVNRVSVVGSTPTTGNITLADEDTATWSAGAPGTATNIVGYIAAGDKEGNMLIFSVASRYNGRLMEFIAGALANGGSSIVYINRYDGFGFVVLDTITIAPNTEIARKYEIPPRIYPKSDIKVLGNSTASTTDLYSRLALALT